ncbi:MAG: alkaline phosphatase D family protein [bacterium]|jgi:alkaline phosphatase D
MARKPVVQKVLFFLLVSCLLPESDSFAASNIGTPRIMQGPMIGYVTPHEITIWARINGSFPFYVEYDEHPDFSNARKTEPITASRDEDYTVRVQLTDLKPDTVYYYRAFVNNHADPYVKYSPALSCKTAPETPARFRVAFGSCARIQRDPIQPIWNVVQNWNPDLFIWLGDNIYGDSPDIDILREEYRRQREVPSSLPVLRSIPQLAVWDDHDYALNNHDRTNPAKEKALQAFQEYWANPAYGLPEVPGVFFDYQYGGVDFFFLDVRYHRSPNEEEDGESKTMLGAEQLEWLKTKLSESKAPFKVLVSRQRLEQCKRRWWRFLGSVFTGARSSVHFHTRSGNRRCDSAFRRYPCWRTECHPLVGERGI